MTKKQAYVAAQRVAGPCGWVGYEVVIRAAPMTLGEASHTIANARHFIPHQTLHCIANQRLAKTKEAQVSKSSEKPLQPHGRGMTRRADKNIAQKAASRLQGALPALRDNCAMSSGKEKSSNRNNGSSGRGNECMSDCCTDGGDKWGGSPDPFDEGRFSEDDDGNGDEEDDDFTDQYDSDATVDESDGGYTTE